MAPNDSISTETVKMQHTAETSTEKQNPVLEDSTPIKADKLKEKPNEVLTEISPSLDVTESNANAPTPEEEQNLRHVPGPVPWIAFVLCIVEFAERASYYGATQAFSNFLTYPLPQGGNGAGAVPREGPKALVEEQNAGALNKGSQFASAFTLLFKFLAYTLPIFGAWIGDVKIGRYSAIMAGVLICGASHIIQIFGALPSVLQKDQGVAPFLISLFLLAIGAGIFKPNILPTVLDQYRDQNPYVQTLKTGERVIVDPGLTINRISLIFYSFVNIGALLGIPTSYAARLVGFWLAFLIPGIIYFLLPLLLIFTKKFTYVAKPNGSELDSFFKIIGVAMKRNRGAIWKKNFLDSAKPSVLQQTGLDTTGGTSITWTDKTVDDVKQALQACRLFLFFPLWYLNDGGVGVAANVQAGAMTKRGVPNDLLGNLNPITVIIFSPLLAYVIYPLLQRLRIMPGRIKRIAIGFTLAWISSIYGAMIQWYIYKTSPCGHFSTKCKVDPRVSPLSIWAQIPVFILGAMSECFVQVTAYEIAYEKAPKNMKAIVMSAFLFTNAISSAIALIAAPGIKDPYLVWVWVVPGISLFLITIIFYWHYRKLDKEDTNQS